MDGHLVALRDLTDHAAVKINPTRSDVHDAKKSGVSFWLDIADLDSADLDILRDDFGFHPLAIEDAEQFRQRPKIDEYDEFVFVVAYGITVDGNPIEMHFFVGDEVIITIHRNGESAVTETLRQLQRRRGAASTSTAILHAIWDVLTDQFYPHLEALDDRIDALEDAVINEPQESQFDEAIDLKRQVITTRRLATEQRDVLASVVSSSPEVLGISDEEKRYFRDIHDHFVQISHTADGYRELLSSTLNIQLTAASNRLNDVMKQLTLIATIFLPLSFLTGFFGQNFGWMVDRVGSAWWFFFGGIGIPCAVVVVLILLFRRQGWVSTQRNRRRNRENAT